MTTASPQLPDNLLRATDDEGGAMEALRVQNDGIFRAHGSARLVGPDGETMESASRTSWTTASAAQSSVARSSTNSPVSPESSRAATGSRHGRAGPPAHRRDSRGGSRAPPCRSTRSTASSPDGNDPKDRHVLAAAVVSDAQPS